MPLRIPRRLQEDPLWRMTFLGFYAGPSHLRKYMICMCIPQIAFVVFCCYTYYSYNGGLVPYFLQDAGKMTAVSGIHALHHFKDAQGDGSRITWAHAVNNKQRLESALNSNVMMMEADVQLRGQGTGQQQLVPIMAEPPQVDSDLTFEDWVHATKSSGKGLKIDFKSIEAVELALQTLQGVRSKLRGPVWLNGEILQGPNTEERPIDWQRFLRLCQEHFDESTISLGWKVGYAEERTKNAYTWPMVKAMHDVIEKRKLRQPVTFAARAIYLKYSVPQLQWLMEMTGGTLSVYSPESDSVPVGDLMYVRNKLHKDQVFFDLPESLRAQFESVKDREPEKVVERKDDQGMGFSVDDWILARGERGETIFLGSEAVILQRGQLLSKSKYPMDNIKMLQLVTRVQFIPAREMEKPAGEIVGDVGVADINKDDFNLEIYLHVIQGARPSAISGIRCSVSPTGKVSVGTKAIPGTDSEKSGLLNEPVSCVDIYIEELPSKGVLMKVSSLEECNSATPNVLQTMEVKLPIHDLHLDGEHIAIRGVGTTSFAAIPRFHITLSDHL